MKAKRICQQCFLWLLTALSGGALVWASVALRRARAAVSGADFLDTAVRSVDEAAALLDRVDAWTQYRRAALIALAVSAGLTALYYVWRAASRRIAARPPRPKKPAPAREKPAAAQSPAFCIHCGAPVDPGAAFCLTCGKKLG